MYILHPSAVECLANMPRQHASPTCLANMRSTRVQMVKSHLLLYIYIHTYIHICTYICIYCIPQWWSVSPTCAVPECRRLSLTHCFTRRQQQAGWRASSPDEGWTVIDIVVPFLVRSALRRWVAYQMRGWLDLMQYLVAVAVDDTCW